MKLLDTLNKTNTIEKTSFFKMLSALIDEAQNSDKIDEILEDNRQIKELEYERLAKIFMLLKDDYKT